MADIGHIGMADVWIILDMGMADIGHIGMYGQID